MSSTKHCTTRKNTTYRKRIVQFSMAILAILSCVNVRAQVSSSKPDRKTTNSSTATFKWPEYSPGLNYDFKAEYPQLSPPTKVLDDCKNVTGTITSDWWCFRWGPNANKLVTEASIRPMLAYFESEFSYFRNVMGWPADLRARSGYKSAIYLFGSGLCTDNEPNTALGGWQGAIDYDGKSWPMVLASYYPVYSFDPATPYKDAAFQRSAMIHEGIHAVLADYPGVKKSAWFHEGGNVWFQQTMDAHRSQNFSSLGFLGAADAIAPFVPIECYSGWLQDGSFGGPSAEGVNKFEGDKQICTWRTLLGGKQYSSVFPTFVGEVLGNGAVPWIWRYAEGRVLEGMSKGLGVDQTRRLITEYRAKQATADLGKWRDAYTKLIDQNFGVAIKQEWEPSWIKVKPWTATPYVKIIKANTLWKPDPLTLPGWSGGNQIPLLVHKGAQTVTIDFNPMGKNMTCQLVYRSTDGEAVYSPYVNTGKCTLSLKTPPANGIVIVVVANNDYIYQGEETRKAKFDYRLKFVEGVAAPADIHKRWYQWEKLKI